jgi:MFS family permease
MTKDSLLTWGWRLPFLVSIVLLGLGVYIRAKVTETPVFQEAAAKRPPLKLPALEAVRRSPRNFFVVVGARLAENALGYLYPVFGVSYLINTLHVPRNVAIMGTIAGSVALIIGALGFATLSDRIGRRPVYIFGALFSAACAFPFFLLVGTREPALIVLAFVVEMGIGSGAMFGPQAVYFAELFGPRLRYSGFAFARELGSIIAGGPAPLIAATLVAWMAGAPWAVCVYVVAISLVTAFAVWCGPETYKNDIRADDVQDLA